MNIFLLKHVLKMKTIETIILRFIKRNDTINERFIEFVPWTSSFIAMDNTLGAINKNSMLPTAYLSYRST